MPIDDSLDRLLRIADESAGTPKLSVDLAGQVRHRRTQQLARSKRIKVSSFAAIALLVCAILSLREITTIDDREQSTQIARLRAEAAALSAEADALQHRIIAVRSEQSRQELREEYRHQLAANIDSEATGSPIDRAAAIALCQGDFYWDVQRNRAPAQAAYQSILDNYPDSSLASVAHARLQLLQMN